MIEIIRSEIDPPFANAPVIDAHFDCAAAVRDAIELIGGAIGAIGGPGVDGIKTGDRNIRRIFGDGGFCRAGVGDYCSVGAVDADDGIAADCS